MRADLSIIQSWIDRDSRVLDLGCGDGDFLVYLKENRNVHDCGLEIDHKHINNCLQAGVNVIEQDLDDGLSNFETGSFDTVLLTLTLQAVQKPDELVEEMLRVGKRCIITFHNFAYWRYRFYLMSQGKMPISPDLPFEWYNTPNIHFCTISDFDALCKERNIRVLQRTVVDHKHRANAVMNLFPNFLGNYAIYHITR